LTVFAEDAYNESMSKGPWALKVVSATLSDGVDAIEVAGYLLVRPENEGVVAGSIAKALQTGVFSKSKRTVLTRR